jgi:MFS family permease
MSEAGIPVVNAEIPWYREINAYQWRTLVLAILGYTLDAMDFLMYALVIGPIMKEFAISPATAGFIATVVLVAASAGGYVFGVLTDYIGRARTLVITVLVYSAGTFFSAFSSTWVQLLFWRSLLGLGMGGEWGPGMALVMETWPVKHRAKALGMVQCSWAFGWLLALGASVLIVPRWGWRGLFMVGILPAIIVSIARWRMTEPEIWERARKGAKRMFAPAELFTKRYLGTTILLSLLAILGAAGYYAFAIWQPTVLTAPVAKGGAGLPRSDLTFYLVITYLTAIVGYNVFGYYAEKWGRKPAFLVWSVFTTIGLLIYSFSDGNFTMLVVGMLLISFFTTFYAGYGLIISEMYDTRVRGSALGFIFNTGRLIGGQAPVIVGTMAASVGFAKGTIIAVPAMILMVILLFWLKETRGKELDVV